MSRRSASNGSARAALVGASSVAGNLLREALETLGVPGARVDLYGEQSGPDVLLGEYAGEARLILDVR